jgi:hypothetical protein
VHYLSVVHSESGDSIITDSESNGTSLLSVL